VRVTPAGATFYIFLPPNGKAFPKGDAMGQTTVDRMNNFAFRSQPGEKRNFMFSSQGERKGKKLKNPPQKNINLRTECALRGTTSLVAGDKNTCTVLTRSSNFELKKLCSSAMGTERGREGKESRSLRG
jgi:hypothetical protein